MPLDRSRGQAYFFSVVIVIFVNTRSLQPFVKPATKTATLTQTHKTQPQTGSHFPPPTTPIAVPLSISNRKWPTSAENTTVTTDSID